MSVVKYASKNSILSVINFALSSISVTPVWGADTIRHAMFGNLLRSPPDIIAFGFVMREDCICILGKLLAIGPHLPSAQFISAGRFTMCKWAQLHGRVYTASRNALDGVPFGSRAHEDDCRSPRSADTIVCRNFIARVLLERRLPRATELLRYVVPCTSLMRPTVWEGRRLWCPNRRRMRGWEM